MSQFHIARGAGFAFVVAVVSVRAEAAPLTMEQAVAIALQRNRDVVAARLDIEGAQLDVVAARVYPNPVLEYSLGNLVLGHGNPQPQGTPPTATVSPGFLDQTVQSLGVTEVLDVWGKRSARVRAAGHGVDHQRLVTEDALREVAYAVRSAFADVGREQGEWQLARDVEQRYAETVRLSQARYTAGDISEAELRKIEIEALRYRNNVIDAAMQLDLTRQKLAVLMGLSSASELSSEGVQETGPRPSFDVVQLTNAAWDRRPDLRAAGAARTTAEAHLSAAKRELCPDLSLGVTYTHDNFTISGDNPNTLGLSLSLPLPLFDRNQAGVGRASLDIRRAENDRERLRIEVARQVAEAVRKAGRSQTLLQIFEGGPTEASSVVGAGVTSTHDKGGMLARADIALRVAEKSYKAGAASLLDLLEAQRTYLDTRAQYLRAMYDFRQATVDVTHAVGE